MSRKANLARSTLLSLIPANTMRNFSFYWPRYFVGMDVYNGGPQDATVTIRCPEMREVKFTIKSGELRRSGAIGPIEFQSVF